MLTSRSIELIKYILNKDNRVDLKELAEFFKLSERSIRYEIDKINDELGSILISLNKGEFFVENSHFLKSLIDKNTIYVPSSQERQLYILLKICIEREINQNKIADDLNISRSTVKTHLKEIKDTLSSYNLKLEIVPRKGLELIGSEEQIRQCLLKILIMVKKQKSEFLNQIIGKYFGDISPEGIKLFINYCQKNMEKIVSDEAYEIITVYLNLTIYFIKKSYLIENIKNSVFLETTQEFQSVQKSKALIEGFYEIEISKNEALKITDFFLGSHTYNISYSYYENWVEIEIIVKKIIDVVNKNIEVDISNDETLKLGLINHIKPTLYRIKNGLELENSIYEDVIESYPKIFMIVKKAVEELELFIDEKFTNDEIAFLTIHFKAAIDRNTKNKKEKMKILIVCGSGYGSSNLLAQQIQELYRVEIIDTIPKYLLEKVGRRSDIDIILTTVPIEDYKTDKTIIKVNSILTNEDINRLNQIPLPKDNKKIILSHLINVIEENSNIEADNKLISSLKNFLGNKVIDDIFQKKFTLTDLLSEEDIILKGKATNWKDAIEEAGSLLVKNGYVTEKYIESMIETVNEFGSYIQFIPHVIFPHAKGKDEVNKTGFSIVTYDKPIQFLNDLSFSVVICFSSKNNREHLDLLLSLIEKLEDDKIIKKVISQKSKKDVLNMLSTD